MNKLSIVVCTHNHDGRFNGLKKTVSSLSTNSNNNFILEIIIIDNGGSILQNEKKVLSNINPKIIFITENKLGLSVARNTGVKNSKSMFIAFIDDDVWVDNMWAKNILGVYENNHVLCAGGELKMINIDIVKNKRWVSNYFLRFLFPTSFPSETGIINEPYFLVGANMSFRKKVFEDYGLFEEKLGRISGRLLSCEDTEYISRLPNESVFFVKNAKVLGEIDEGRLTKKYMLKRLFWQGYSDYIFVQKVGTDRFFDRKEVFFGLDFIKYSLSKLLGFKFFEFICTFARISGFYISKKQN